MAAVARPGPTILFWSTSWSLDEEGSYDDEKTEWEQ
jgi:hypothetical protein